MNNKVKLLKLKEYFKTNEIVKSFLTGIIFFIVPAALITTLVVSSIILYVPYIEFFLLGLFIILSSLTLFTNKVIIETLFNYQDKTLDLDYKTLYYKLLVIAIIIIGIVIIISYLIYKSYL